MPWKECHVMDERLRFVARLLDGERMTTLCVEFGISRKTGYKIYHRYKASGIRRASPTVVDGRNDTRISCPRRSSGSSCD
jgi:transposase